MKAGNKTILLVEDNEDDVIFMRRALRTAEVTQPLQVVSDGQEAIDYLSGTGQFADRTQYPLPGMVLLDLKLPRKSGLEVLQWIREHNSLRPLIVIILSTSKENSDISRAYHLGANSYIVKPAAVGQLIELIKAIKGFWLEFNEIPPMR